MQGQPLAGMRCGGLLLRRKPVRGAYCSGFWLVVVSFMFGWGVCRTERTEEGRGGKRALESKEDRRTED